MFSEWILMLTAVACLGALLDPIIPNGFKSVRGVLALIIAVTILSPIFAITKTDLKLSDMESSGYEELTDYDINISAQITQGVKDKIYEQTRSVFEETTGYKPYAMEVKTELDSQNNISINLIKIVTEYNITETQREEIERKISQLFGPEKIQIVKVD